jgi:hypothetical protein
MFAPNFFELSCCWVLNKDDRSVGRNFLRVIFQYLLEEARGESRLSLETSTLLENGRYGEHALHLSCFSLEVGCCRLTGDLLFIPVHA